VSVMKNFIPVKIQPGFFITAAIIGFINSFSLIGTLIWVGIIFISVLVHEYGHALTAKLFGQKPRIELIAFGGLTIPEGPKIKLWKEFLVVLMGPMFGFLLFAIASIILQFPITNTFIRAVLGTFRFVNLFWTFINLLPILPLDGGQLVRVIFESFLGSKAWKATLYLSLVFSILFAIPFFLLGLFLIGAIFLIFAFQSVETLRRMQNYSESDQSDDNREKLKEIEQLLVMNRYQEAIPKLDLLIQKTQSGLIHTLASEYLAKIYFDRGENQHAYDILAPIEKNLSKEAKCILYLVAYEVRDYDKVISLSGVCFQEKRTVDVAIRAAASHAVVHNIHKSIEWLKTAKSFGNVDLQTITKDTAFDSIRNEEAFQSLFK